MPKFKHSKSIADMLDPVTAIGLTASVISIVKFGLQFCSEVNKTRADKDIEIDAFSAVAEGMKRAHRSLTSTLFRNAVHGEENAGSDAEVS